MEDGKVESDGVLEDSKFLLLSLCRAQRHGDVLGVHDLRIVEVLRRDGQAEPGKIVVLRQEVLGYDGASVPVHTDIVHELVILSSKEEPVLPVLLILINYLLFNVLGYRDSALSDAEPRGALHLDVFLSGLLLLLRVDVFGHLAFVEEEVRIAPFHGLELHHVVASVDVLSAEGFPWDVGGVKVPHLVVVHLIPLLALRVLSVLDERVVVPRIRCT